LNVERIRYERPGAAAEQVGSRSRDWVVEKPDAAEIEEFNAFLKAAGPSVMAARVARRNSPSEDITDFIMPRLAEPALLQAGRSLAILEELIGAIIPTFEDSQEFQSVASAVIHTEIARRRDLQERLHRGISA
jgi:hypothetical protein